MCVCVCVCVCVKHNDLQKGCPDHSPISVGHSIASQVQIDDNN